jgi:integrase
MRSREAVGSSATIKSRPRFRAGSVMARLGHADPSITLRVYAHVISDQLTEAADIFARAVAATS